MKKLIAIAALVAATVTTASAQVRFGPEVGVNMASAHMKATGLSESSKMKVGARIGAVADIPLTTNIYLRPGIQFSMMGSKAKVGDATTSLNYVQIPVNLLYKFGDVGLGRFYAGLTPYLGFAIGGKHKVGGNSADIKFGSNPGEMKSLDFGAGLKVGYELPMGLYFDAAYMLGLGNMSNVSGVTTTNRNITIGVGYLF